MAIPRYRGLAATPPKPKVARAADPAPREERISDVAPIGTHARTERPSGTATRPSGERVAVRLPSPGDLLAGRYRIVRPLGRGGMSVVYEAFHARTEAQVAVKVLYPELLQKDEAVRRFLRESRALSRLHSPHVVQVLDADTTEAGLPFTVMELLSGQDLGDVWAGTSPPLVRDVAEYVAQACVGLAAAHAAGIVHRDVKPGNLFLAEEGDTKRVKLIDFGVAKLRERCSTGLVTRHGETIGTPLYMAPEQIRAKPVDGRADVWALGVVMYRVLSGRTPFEGKSDQQYLLAVIEQTPRHLAELRPDLPRALADVVMKALAQNVDARHADAMALADALAPFRAAAPAAAPRAPAAPPRATVRPTAASASATDRGGPPRPRAVTPPPLPTDAADEAPSTLRDPTMPVASMEMCALSIVPSSSGHRVLVDPQARESEQTISSEPSIPISLARPAEPTPVMSSAPPRPLAPSAPPISVAGAHVLSPSAAPLVLAPPAPWAPAHWPGHDLPPPASALAPLEPSSRPLRSATELVSAPRRAGGLGRVLVALVLLTVAIALAMTAYAVFSGQLRGHVLAPGAVTPGLFVA